MTLPLAGIVASYVLIMVLLLSLNLASGSHWGMKAAAIVLTTGFFGCSFLLITSPRSKSRICRRRHCRRNNRCEDAWASRDRARLPFRDPRPARTPPRASSVRGGEGEEHGLRIRQ